jgi:hypothetical protein
MLGRIYHLVLSPGDPTAATRELNSASNEHQTLLFPATGHSNNVAFNCFHLGGRAFHSRSLPPTQQGYAALHKNPRGSATQEKSTYFKDHATPGECLPLPHSPTPRPHIRHIARPPTPQLSSRLDSRATHARTFFPQHWLLCHLGLY